MKKRILTLLLAGLLAVSAVACNKPEENPNDGGTSGTGTTYETDKDGYKIVKETVYAVTDKLNLREKASTSSEKVATVDFGTVMTRLKEGDVWSLVEYEGEECYVMSEYVTTDDLNGENFTTCDPTEMHTTASANVRKYPTKNSYVENNIVKTLSTGTTVTVIGESDDWYKISMDGKQYYINADLLDEGKVASKADLGDFEKKFEDAKLDTPKTMYATDSLRIRQYPSTAEYSTVLGSFKAGTEVTVYSIVRIGTSGNKWAQIKINETVGDNSTPLITAYVSYDYLSEKKVGDNTNLDSLLEAYTFDELEEDLKMWVPETYSFNVIVRKTPSIPEGDLSNKKGLLKPGEEVTVIALGTGDYADWCMISLGDEGCYFVHADYLTTDENKQPMLTLNSALKYDGIKACEEVVKTVKISGGYYINPLLNATYKRGDLAVDTQVTVVAQGKHESYDVSLIKVGSAYWFVDSNKLQ